MFKSISICIIMILGIMYQAQVFAVETEVFGCENSKYKTEDKIKLTYENMKGFMEGYCSDYTKYANDEKTIDKVDKYWAPDFIATAYFQAPGAPYPLVYKSRKEFKDMLIKTHVDIKDTMHPKNFIIDEKQCIVVIPIKIEKENRKTGEITMVDGVGTYKLVIDENDTMKIKSLDFFWHAPSKILQKYS